MHLQSGVAHDGIGMPPSTAHLLDALRSLAGSVTFDIVLLLCCHLLILPQNEITSMLPFRFPHAGQKPGMLPCPLPPPFHPLTPPSQPRSTSIGPAFVPTQHHHAIVCSPRSFSFRQRQSKLLISLPGAIYYHSLFVAICPTIICPSLTFGFIAVVHSSIGQLFF